MRGWHLVWLGLGALAAIAATIFAALAIYSGVWVAGLVFVLAGLLALRGAYVEWTKVRRQ
jgi:hypothetical protein